jgi:hypothetical protein
LDTEQPPEGMPWLLAADRGLLGRPLALLLQPSPEAINCCRQQGYGVLVLGACPQADLFGLPLDWLELERWLLEQLPEMAGPQVVLAGTQEGDAGEMARRLQQARPLWPLVAKATDLPPQTQGMLLPAFPGWDRQDLRILASSSGLHDDGWLETSSRLVIQLLDNKERHDALRLGLYLPEQGLQALNPTVQIQLQTAESTLSQVLKPGLNSIVLSCPSASLASTLVLNLSSAPLVQPANPSDQRQLMAVLVDLERCSAGADTVAAPESQPVA